MCDKTFFGLRYIFLVSPKRNGNMTQDLPIQTVFPFTRFFPQSFFYSFLPYEAE